MAKPWPIWCAIAQVAPFDIGAKPGGLATVQWDGKDDAGGVQPKGAYTVQVKAKTADGNTVDVSQEATGLVKSISFQGGVTTLVLDNGVNAPASDLIQVNR